MKKKEYFKPVTLLEDINLGTQFMQEVDPGNTTSNVGANIFIMDEDNASSSSVESSGEKTSPSLWDE